MAPARTVRTLLLLLAAAPPAAAGGTDEFVLPNRLHVRFTPVAGAGETVVLLGSRGGALLEPAGSPHLAHVLEHGVFHGLPPDSPEAKLAARGFPLRANAETMAGFVYLYLTAGPGELDTALAAARRWLSAPRFSAETLAAEVPKALSEVDSMEISAMGGTHKFAVSAFAQAAFHGKTEVALRERSRAFTVDDLHAFHASLFRPDRCVLSVVGEFDAAAARARIEKAFGSLPPLNALEAIRQEGMTLPPLPAPKSGTVRWDLKTAHLVAAWPAPPRTDPDHAALSALAPLLTQRLAMDPELRRLARVPIASNDGDGVFFVDLQAKSAANLDAILARARAVLTDLAGERAPSEPEAAMARNAFVQLHGLVDPESIPIPEHLPKFLGRLNLEISRLGRSLPWDGATGYAERVARLDAAAMRAAAARHLDPGKAAFVRIEPSEPPAK